MRRSVPSEIYEPLKPTNVLPSSLRSKKYLPPFRPVARFPSDKPKHIHIIKTISIDTAYKKWLNAEYPRVINERQ